MLGSFYDAVVHTIIDDTVVESEVAIASVVGACPCCRANDDDLLNEVKIHDCPMVRLLTTHRISNYAIDILDAKRRDDSFPSATDRTPARSVDNLEGNAGDDQGRIRYLRKNSKGIGARRME
jgi:hypothetical protein